MPEIRAFLIADVRGYTHFTHEHGDEAAARLAERFLRVARTCIDAHGGSVIDQRGDEVAATFVSGRDAVRAAIDLQERFVEETLADPTLPLTVGIGLDAGEAVPLEHGYRGGALNLAARLCDLAGPGEVLASPVIVHLARAIEGVEYSDRGTVTVKGLSEPVGLVKVSAAGADAAARLAPFLAEASSRAAVPAGRLAFRILGPLEVLAGDRTLALGGTKQRAVLALLLTRAGEVVSRDRLIEELWAGEPPPTAVAIVQTYISHLRKELGHDVLQTRPPGYALDLAGHELDLVRFEALLREARDAPAQRAAELLRQALGLWRGPALADFAYEPFAQAEIGRLEELRLAAIERRIDADLALGRHSELAGELEALVEKHPLRERFRSQLMLALYRAGRQAEALEAYQQARRVLVDELGIDPSPALQQLEKAILVQDASLALATDAQPASQPAADGAGLQTPERAILVAPLQEHSLEALLALGELLARRPPREIIVATLVSDPNELAPATARAQRHRRELVARRVAARVAVFTSSNIGSDIVLIASEQPTDLVLIDAPAEVLDAGTIGVDLATVLTEAPCDVGLLVARDSSVFQAGRPVVVPFSGAEHDWSAIEIAAWISRSLGVSLQLLGTTADPSSGRRDASRLLARASLMVQQMVGVDTEPLLVAPGESALIDAAERAGLLVVGLSPRWRREGLGPVRLAVARHASPPTLLVRRGLRPGGIAPRDSITRFTWTLAAKP